MRHRSILAALAACAFFPGCQKSAPEQAAPAQVAPAAAAASGFVQTAEAPIVAAKDDEMPALPLIPAGQVIDDLAPATPAGELPLAIAVPATEEIKPELAAAFEKLFEPGLEGEKWEAVHMSLVEAGADAVPVLKKALASSDVSRREQASSILSLLGAVCEPAIPELLKSLKDESAFVRATSAAALASFSTYQEKAKATLLELLDSRDPE
ncbi:MAG TPA: HEAT repeat domain-containing protein, partial [Caulifigura sp.]|nr:HEAT repeat domain-containing protein [Caulifigura sp.]